MKTSTKIRPKILKEDFLGIKKPKWWTQEAPAVLQLCTFAPAFIDTKDYYRPSYGVLALFFKNDFCWQVLEKGKSVEMAKTIHKKYLSNPGYIDERYKTWKSLRKRLFDLQDELHDLNLAKLSNKDLWQKYDRLIQMYTDTFTPSLIMEAFVPYVDYYLLPTLKKEVEDAKKVQKYLTVLTAPLEMSFLSEERLSFLHLEQEVFENSTLKKHLDNMDIVELEDRFPNFCNGLVSHQRKFFWVKNNYKDTNPISLKKFLASLRQEIKSKSLDDVKKEIAKIENHQSELKKQKKTIWKKVKLSASIKSLIKLLEFLGYWQDLRKHVSIKTGYYINGLLKEIGNRFKLDLSQMQYFLYQEIKELLLNGQKPDLEEAERRRLFGLYLCWEEGEVYLSDTKAKRVWDIIFSGQDTKQKVINGLPACTGRVEGRTRIVLDPKIDEFNEGEVLVTSMTRPEFLPLMKKAIAIVTDEGGLTCHAAIVSRELNIPCIVGTKMATKVFKNGQKIEVNASHGSIKILK